MAQVITRSDAEALIPNEVSKEIIKAVPESSYAMRLLRKLPNMSAKKRRMPVMSALVSAGFVNGDMGLKMTTKAAWKDKWLEAEEIAAIVPIPEAVLDDADYDIWGELKPSIVEALGVVADGAIFFDIDRPSTWPAALVTQAIAAGNQVVLGTGADIADDVSQVMGLVEADGYDVSGFASDVMFKANLRGLRDKNNNPIYLPSLTAGTPNTLYGSPIEHVKNGVWDSTKARVLAGDFSQAVYSIRQDVTYKVLDQAVITDGDGKVILNLAQQDMVALRIVMRLAWQVANPVNRMNTNEATRFPFGVLVP